MDFEEEITRRMTKVEQDLEVVKQDLIDVKQRLAVIESNYATKADLLAVKNSIIMWVISAFLLTQFVPPLLKRLGG